MKKHKKNNQALHKYFTYTDLRKRGWSNKLIFEKLKKPDYIKISVKTNDENRHTKMFLKESVYHFEKNLNLTPDPSPYFKKKKRSKEQIKDINKMLSYINQIKIEIPDMSEKELYLKAIARYNFYWSEHGNKGEMKFANLDSNKKFLKRIVINMLRHEYTKHEEILEDKFKKMSYAGYVILKEKINKKILEKYQFLKDGFY